MENTEYVTTNRQTAI